MLENVDSGTVCFCGLIPIPKLLIAQSVFYQALCLKFPPALGFDLSDRALEHLPWVCLIP